MTRKLSTSASVNQLTFSENSPVVDSGVGDHKISLGNINLDVAAHSGLFV